jgi:hypothetical protein
LEWTASIAFEPSRSLNNARYALIAAGLLNANTLAGCGQYAAVPSPSGETKTLAAPRSAHAIRFTFQTLGDANDPGFNELLGINNESHLAGFYGSGSASNPSNGYVALPPYQQNNFRLENYPHALDTDVTSINNTKTFAGFFLNDKDQVLGFTQTNGFWTEYQDPHAAGTESVTELLGGNDADIAVGFYKSKAVRYEQPFKVKMSTGVFTPLKPPGAVAAVATGINGRGDIVGYEKKSPQVTVGFLLRDGAYTIYSFPKSKDTKFLGVTILDRIAGSYVDSRGVTHGFLLIDPLRHAHTAWQSIDDPSAARFTVVTGINIHYDLVGYYVDAEGETHGFLATPRGGY